MIKIKKNYIYDENRKLLAVQIPIEEYKKLEEIIENHVLSNLIDEVTGDEVLDVKEAKDFYNALNKK
jgi:hypothetical protein